MFSDDDVMAVLGQRIGLTRWCKKRDDESLSPRSAFHGRFQLGAGMESNNATCCDGNGFSSLGVSTGTLRFLAQVKVAKAGEFYPITTFEGQTCLIEEGFDHIRGFAFVQANFFKKKGRRGLPWSMSYGRLNLGAWFPAWRLGWNECRRAALNSFKSFVAVESCHAAGGDLAHG
jgi:hypothetical protein